MTVSEPKKRAYVKPTTHVVALELEHALLAGSADVHFNPSVEKFREDDKDNDLILEETRDALDIQNKIWGTNKD